MKNLNQQILKFDYDQNFKDQDFYVSNSNQHSFTLLNSWPKWEKNFVNLIGEKFSGKTHLINIFLEKYKGIKIDAKNITNDFIKNIKIHENIVLENIDEKLIDFIIKRIDRSYGNISDFIYKIDEISLKSRKPIDFKIIKEALGD